MGWGLTLDLSIRCGYVPPWLDKGGAPNQRVAVPTRDSGLPVDGLSRHPVLVRIGQRGFLPGLADPVRAKYPDVTQR